MESHLAVLAEEGSNRGHRTLAEKAFDTLHAAIITGQLRPGARLPIEELADVLEMSPMPIREAVRRLDAAGFVEKLQAMGVDEVMCMMQMGTVPQDVCMETIRQWGETIIPRFR